MTDRAIAIPADLLPYDGRFGSGPSLVRPEQSAALAAVGQSLMGTSHRQAPVRALVSRVQECLTRLLDAPDGYQVVLGNGGTTTFWDVATFGLIRQRAQHVDCGEFGAKFAAATAAAPFLRDPVVLTAERGTGREPQAGEGIDAYCWVHNETSTGVVNQVRRVDDAEALMLVDGTSAAGGIPVDLGQTDVYYFAPQKSFGSDGGLWLALCSPAALKRTQQLRDRWVPPSLSMDTAVENSRAHQTLNTPAIATLFLMAEQLEWLLDNGGMDFAAARCAASAQTLYSWADSRDYTSAFVSDPAYRSPVVGTIDVDPAIDAPTVSAALRANGIVDTEPYRKLGRNQLRIGMYPAVDPADVEALTACVDYVVEQLG